MSASKIKENIEHLRKIREIIEISKFDVLNKIQNERKIVDSFQKIAINAKKTIEFAVNNYWVNSSLMRKRISKKNIWIFVSISSKLFSASYLKQEKLISNSFNREKDKLIVVGTPAINLANRLNITPIYKEEDINNSLIKMPSLIASISKSKDFPNIKFVSNSSFLNKNEVSIVPFDKMDNNIESKKWSGKISFFPSLPEAILSFEEIYLKNISIALLKDAKYFFLKEKLMRHENSLNSIDEKILIKKRELSKLKRKNEMDELLLASKISKRNDNG